jgi:hypothetical protein
MRAEDRVEMPVPAVGTGGAVAAVKCAPSSG